jgi:hypothetical protein
LITLAKNEQAIAWEFFRQQNSLSVSLITLAKNEQATAWEFFRQQNSLSVSLGCFVVGTGGYLCFQAVTSSVFSAYKGLTSVFGMGTGGTP